MNTEFQRVKNSDAAIEANQNQIKSSNDKLEEQATVLQQTKSDLQDTNNKLLDFQQQTNTSIGQLTSE